MPVIECDVDQARRRLEDAGVTIAPGNTEHERWRADQDGAVAVAYDDKVVIQGETPRTLEAILHEGADRAHGYFDGASRGNPGPAAIGWVIVSGDGIVDEGGERIGEATNNQAEYAALLAVLKAAAAYGFSELHLRGDSELVVKQVRGEYDTNDPTLTEHRVTAHERLREFDEWSIEYVPRTVNERADTLANEALDGDR